jgi:hypothetical protein
MVLIDADDDDDKTQIFLNEVRVGMTPGISRVGPRIYGFRIKFVGTQLVGSYIMDDFVKGDTSVKSLLLYDYIQKYRPGPNHVVFKKLKTTLRNFWLISKGYHGDLHTNNIAVVFKSRGTVVRVMIFDYGAHKRTKTKFTRNMSLADMARIINANFARSELKSPATLYPEGVPVQTKVYYPMAGQPRRSNADVLRAHAANTGSLRTGLTGQKSIMNVLMRVPRKPRAAKAPSAPDATANVNVKGRPIYKGARGGFYVLDAKGKKMYKFTRAPVASPPKAPLAANTKGRLIHKGPRGGFYVMGATGKKIYKYTRAPAASPPKAPHGVNTKGRVIHKGARGGFYVMDAKGKKIYKAAKGRASP